MGSENKPTIEQDHFEVNKSDLRYETPDGKYYTPQLGEFHVGFEYELYDMVNSNKWLPYVVEDLEDLIDCPNSLSLEGHIEAKYIRVKYLDQEDIQSLGFVKSNLKDESLYSTKKKIKLYPHLDPYHIYLRFNEGISHVLIFYMPPSNPTHRNGVNLFVGKIKNKSELKRLLVQLGVLKDK